MKKLIAVTIFTLLLTISSFAQVLTEKDFEIPARKETKYDRFKDKTTVSLTIPITSIFSLTFDNSYDGEKRTSPPTKVVASFMSLDISERYLISRSCIILADKERIRLDNGTYLSEGEGEVLFFFLSLENFKKIANAKKIEMQLGSNNEFALGQSRIDAIKDFYKLLVP